eukprot:6212934-Pleurochrysis_carterae.AAC.3
MDYFIVFSGAECRIDDTLSILHKDRYSIDEGSAARARRAARESSCVGAAAAAAAAARIVASAVASCGVD